VQRRGGPIELERLSHDVEQSFCHQFWSHHGLAAIDQYHELIAAHPADRVCVAQRARHARGHCSQQPITDFMAEGIIDVLEIIEVDVERGAHRPVAAVAGQKLIDAVHDQSSIRQARQGVMERLESKLVGSFVDEDPRLSPS